VRPRPKKKAVAGLVNESNIVVVGRVGSDEALLA
jgi:hypothetical protein